MGTVKTKIFVAGKAGAIKANSYELMTNDMAEVLKYLDANKGAEFKPLYVTSTEGSK